MTRNGLDAHARPPQKVQDVYKQFQKRKVIPPELPIECDHQSFHSIHQINASGLAAAFEDFFGASVEPFLQKNFRVLSSKTIPGLQVVPNALPPAIQKTLLSKLLHRDLLDPKHLTNIHKFYDIPYPASGHSFFSLLPSTNPIFTPKNPEIHKPLSITQFLTKKLRWMTLGGQYDWTAKVYPAGKPPTFPSDITNLLQALFPDMKPEAAIVNLYSPGDTLSMHRDVAEYCAAGLLSISIGCDAIFVIGLDGQSLEGESTVQVLRLKSGDAVYMDGSSRFAWHGVPQVVAGTCPEWLRNWPAGEERDEDGKDLYTAWRGWMEGKRVNLNVRQMWES